VDVATHIMWMINDTTQEMMEREPCAPPGGSSALPERSNGNKLSIPVHPGESRMI